MDKRTQVVIITAGGRMTSRFCHELAGHFNVKGIVADTKERQRTDHGEGG